MPLRTRRSIRRRRGARLYPLLRQRESGWFARVSGAITPGCRPHVTQTRIPPSSQKGPPTPDNLLSLRLDAQRRCVWAVRRELQASAGWPGPPAECRVRRSSARNAGGGASRNENDERPTIGWHPHSPDGNLDRWPGSRSDARPRPSGPTMVWVAPPRRPRVVSAEGALR